MTNSKLHKISVVTPVYQGESTLPGLAEEMAALTTEQVTPDGHRWVVAEWLLVHDHGPDRSPDVLGGLDEKFDFVRPIWLSRNFGQHPATLAGMASSTGDWIATIDEDGQHNPAELGTFLDVAMREQAQLVYANPLNPPPHGRFRNATSKCAKWLVSKALSDGAPATFQSYRLMVGEAGRSVAAYVGTGVYLDVALSWVMDRVAQAPVTLRAEGGRESGYSFRRLLAHFWRLVLTSGTRGLRLVSGLGIAFSLSGFLYAAFIIVQSIVTQSAPPGWPSTFVIILITSGAILFSLGVIAEYIGVLVGMAMGKPPYLIVTDPKDGPWQQRPQPR
ncbi:glycosyltransferase [Tessaracoccus oleiagri]|uniref:Glycosyl transferase family 2 n=1 Tax=Tessaracoccus oleiagri TaxID=686624 RepID=A0A1G9HFE3_9ACTN|nr:glycosyltransferase [Tessaracoccus oleiagri]SDL11738.1 Glycosyl transferase family 2 [Tessaracoccus oleiagri]